MKVPPTRLRLDYAAAAAVGAAALFFFYRKYVPLVPEFQACLLPVLGGLVASTVASLEAGTLVFLFSLPLLNSLPYFFGIDMTVPHAPVALVLSLFFIWAWTVSRALGRGGAARVGPLRTPLAVASGLVAVSGVMTWLRFGNFFPFMSSGSYELMTNVNGVTAGGARMSVVFSALGYLCGFGFFLILTSALKTKEAVGRALTAAGLGFLASSAFGVFQHFGNQRLGNTPFWINLDQINSTFKDPNAFGGFIAVAAPVCLGAALSSRGWRRALLGAAAAAGVYVFPFIGNRSGLLGLAVSAIAFLIIGIMSRPKRSPAETPGPRRFLLWAGVAALSVVLAAAAFFQFRGSRSFERLRVNWANLRSQGALASLSPERHLLWIEAVAMMKEYPLSGVGVGAYIIELPDYFSVEKNPLVPGQEAWRRNDSAENYFLQVGAEMGAIGLAVFVWLFAVIAGKTVRALPGRPALDGPRFLIIGAAAGIVSYLVNILFHSYIGSLEPTLAFWLAVAVIMSGEARPRRPLVEAADSKPGDFSGRPLAPRDRPTRTAARRFAAARRLAAPLLLLVFAAAVLWSSTHSLSLARETARYGLKQQFGFYAPEKTADGREFRWTRKTAGLTIRVEGETIEIPLLATHPDLDINPVRVRVYRVEDFFRKETLLGDVLVLKSDWSTYSFALAPALPGDEIILLLKISRTWNPRKTNGSPDPRNLGVAVGKITFRAHP